MLLVLDGHASVHSGARRVGSVSAGEALGEVAFLNEVEHSLTARADTTVEVGILTRGELDRVVRARPDIGVVVYRNLARGLGRKLQRAR